MSVNSDVPVIPRWFLLGAASLMLATIFFAFVARQTDIGALRVSKAPDIAQLTIRFDPRPDGAVLVRRVSDSAVLEVLPSDGSTFLRGVLRSLHRERAMKRVDRDAPFVLARRPGSRHAIVDPVTGSRIELDGFGPSHSAAINRLMDLGLTTTSSAIPAAPANN